jgi:hypothetical protein
MKLTLFTTAARQPRRERPVQGESNMLATVVGSIKGCRRSVTKVNLSVKDDRSEKCGFCSLTVDVYGHLLENTRLVLFTPVVSRIK